MSPQTIFQTQLVLGYVAWLLCFRIWIMPSFRTMSHFSTQRVIAAFHSFRFFGLAFIVPGVVGPNLPAGFATPAAYGDFASGLLAIMALLTAGIRPLFWFFVVAFNIVGVTDLLAAYYHAMRFGLPFVAGQLGAAYVIPIVYVPLLMITHATAFYGLARLLSATTQVIIGKRRSRLSSEERNGQLTIMEEG